MRRSVAVAVGLVLLACCMATGAVAVSQGPPRRPSSPVGSDVVDPTNPPHADAGDEDAPMHNVDLGAPGQMFESNFTEASKCPACVAFAAAVRRVGWDVPPVEGTGTKKKTRREGLVVDERLEEVALEALNSVVDFYVYVPALRKYAPLEYARAAGVLTEAELALAEKHVEVQGDQGLLDFLHHTLNTEKEEEVETLAGRDVLKGRLPSDFIREPGSGHCDPAATVECADRMNSLAILKDRAADLKERVVFARALCTPFCGKRDVRSALPLEAEDLGVPTLLQRHNEKLRAEREAEHAAIVAEEAKRFPPDTEKDAKDHKAEEEEGHGHGSHDGEGGNAAKTADEIEREHLAAHVRKQAAGGDADDDGEF